ncbi:uncharacterized protein At4g00950-like [Primulina tabacum]|uniref:uncharacterized protein At4g00950-like n=1 Tax=Primulina tabacum TaxID=48773 RepID=UPI003F5981EB
MLAKPHSHTTETDMETEGVGDYYSSLFLTPKLPLLNIMPPTPNSPQRSGTATPPLQTLVSVPFQWEEEPGKPRPCTALIALPEPAAKLLELPPCRMPLIMEPTNKITKTPSPTTVLDAPYNLARPKFSSFRFFMENHYSFDSYSSASPESAVDDIWIGKKSNGRRRGTGFLKWRGGTKEAIGGDFIGFSSSSVASCDSDTESCKKVKMEGKLRRIGSISTVSDARPTTHLWAAVYEGIKQVIPWKSAKKSHK